MLRFVLLFLWVGCSPAFSQRFASYTGLPRYLLPASDSLNAPQDDHPAHDPYYTHYRSWAQMAQLSRSVVGPIDLTLNIGTPPRKLPQRPDWTSLHEVRNVRQLTLQLAMPLTQPVADSLLNALANWPDLEQIEIERADEDGARTVISPSTLDGGLSRQLTTLRRLAIRLDSAESGKVLPLFGQSPSLTELAVGWLAPTDLAPFSRLERLEISRLSTNELPNISFAQLPNLTDLTIQSASGDGAGLSDLLNQGAALKRLTVTLASTSDWLTGFRLTLPRLETLNGSASKALRLPLDAALAGCPALTAVSLINLSDASLDWLAQLPHLERLALSSYQPTAATRRSLRHLMRVTSVSVTGNLPPQMMSALATLPALRELSVTGVPLSTMPPLIGRLSSLTALNVSNCQLRNVPAALGALTRLTRLDLSNNELSRLPAALAQLTQLGDLNLSDNQLTVLPDLGNLTRLERLWVARNKLTYLPATMRACRHLREVDASENPLMRLPDTLGRLDSLRTLNLNTTRLSAIPASVGQLAQLRVLEVGSDRLTALPDALANCRQIERLSIFSAQVAALPRRLFQLTRLTQLHLGLPRLRALPDGLGRLTELTHLELFNTQLDHLPDDIGRLSKLTELRLGVGRLTYLPESLGRLTRLQTLQIRGFIDPKTKRSITDLRRLPDSLHRCKNLRQIEIDGLRALDGADAIRKLAQFPLFEIRLNNCGIESIDGVDWKRVTIKNIRLSNNRLRHVPDAILEMPELLTLDLYNNPLLPPGLQQSFYDKAELRIALLSNRQPTHTDTAPDEAMTWALLNSGRGRQYKKDWTGAVADMNRAVQLAPDSIRAIALLNRGELQMERKQYAVAVTDFKQAIAAEPRPGHRPFGLGRYEGCTTRALLLAQYWSRLSAAHDGLGQYGRAVDALDEAIQLLTDSTDVEQQARLYIEQATVFAHWRKPAEARRCMLAAHALYASTPLLPRTRIDEVELAILSNRPDKALASLAGLKKNLFVGGDVGAPFLHAYLMACTHMLTGTQTLPQAQAALRRYFEATPGYFFIPSTLR